MVVMGVNWIPQCLVLSVSAQAAVRGWMWEMQGPDPCAFLRSWFPPEMYPGRRAVHLLRGQGQGLLSLIKGQSKR